MINVRRTALDVKDSTGRSAAWSRLRNFDTTANKRRTKTVTVTPVTEIEMSTQATLADLIETNRFSLLAWWLFREGYPLTTIVWYGHTANVVAVKLPDGKCYRAKGPMIYS